MIEMSNGSAFRVIAWAGLICGVLDIACTLILSRLGGIRPMRLLQAITSGLVGQKSFEGGGATAAIGLGIHFLIAFTAAGIYYAGSREFSGWNQHAVLCGLLYGIVLHLFMTSVVLPLSALRRPFSAKAFVTQWIVHMFFVGLPIALVVRYFSLAHG